MKAAWSVIVALGLTGAGGEKVAWEKPERAFAASAATGRIICWYFLSGEMVKGRPQAGCWGGVAGSADGSFAATDVARKSASFVCVRGTQKFANHFKVKTVPLVLFTDADGDEIHRAGFGDAAGLDRAMTAALEKHKDKPVSWKPEASAAGRLLVVGFDDESGEALKVLEDKSVVKYHASCDFVKPAAAAAWGVTTTPAILLCDPGTPGKPLERLTGKKSAGAVKAAIQRALARLEKN